MVLKQKVREIPSQLQVCTAIYTFVTGCKHEILTFSIDRDSPENISITPAFPGSSEAKLKWVFSGHEREVDEFCISVEGRERTVKASDREAEVQGLRPSATNHITVTAVYKDNVPKECAFSYQNSGK